MVGYAQNGYRFMKQKIITARDVKFDEVSFPYKSDKTNAEALFQYHIQKFQIEMIN